MKLRLNSLSIAVIAAFTILFAVGGWFAFENIAQAQSLPSPANTRVANGDDRGAVDVSWDAVSGASHYSVRWVNLDAAWAAYRAGLDWQQLIQSVDIADTGETSYTLTVNDLTPGTRYSFGVGSKSTSGATPNWASWVSLAPAGDDGTTDVHDVVRIQSAALAIARNASELIAVGSVPTDASMTAAIVRAKIGEVRRLKGLLNEQVLVLTDQGPAERADYIETLVNDLISNVEAIQTGRGRLSMALRAENASRAALTRDNNKTLFPQTGVSVDRQFYDLVTATDGHVSTEDILQYTHTESLGSNATLGHTLLLVASLMQDPTFVARIQESYDTIGGRVDRDVEYLRDHRPVEFFDDDVLLQAENVRDAGGGEADYFDRLVARLDLVVKERELIEDNAEILDDLLEQVDHLSAEVRGADDVPPVPTPPTADTMDPGITDNQIMFGQSAALTGSNDVLGIGMRLGIRAAFKEANDNGGVGGRQLNLMTENDSYEPDAAFANTLKFVEGDNPVFALIGAVGTPTSRAALPVAKDAGVPFVGAFTGAQLLRGDELTNVLNYRASYHDETDKMVKLLAAADITNVAVLYQNDSYGVDGLMGVKNALNRQDKMELVASWYYRRNTSAVQSAAFRIAAEDPEAVIIIGTSAPAAKIINKLRMKMVADPPVFLSVSFVGSDALVSELDKLGESGEGVYVTQVVPLPSGDSLPILGEYREALTAYKSDAEPNFVSLEGYLAGRLAIARLQACDSDLSRECFLDVGTDPIDIGGLMLQFGANDNQGSDEVYLTVIGADGEYRLADAITR